MKPLRQKPLTRAERARGDSLDGAEFEMVLDGPFGGVKYLRRRKPGDEAVVREEGL